MDGDRLLYGQTPLIRLVMDLSSPVYTIQSVVKPVYNRFDNRLNVCIHDTTGCQTGMTTGCQTGLTTGCIVYTNIQPVVKPV